MDPMAIGLMMAACSSTHSEPDVLLRLDGPGRVRVDQFGPVQGPGLLLEDGSAPEGVQISVEDERVASVQRNQVVAEGPGETRVTAEYGGQTVQWTLVVAPVTVLNFSVAPAELAVGDQVRLEVVARTGDVARTQ